MTEVAQSPFGRPQHRIDGRAKVTGRALYPSDEPVLAPAYAYLLTSVIARGRITGFDLEEAQAIEGVLDILTHENVGHKASPPQQMGGGSTTTLQDDHIWHDGQIIAVIVANTFEAAREAAFNAFQGPGALSCGDTIRRCIHDIKGLWGSLAFHPSSRPPSCIGSSSVGVEIKSTIIIVIDFAIIVIAQQCKVSTVAS